MARILSLSWPGCAHALFYINPSRFGLIIAFNQKGKMSLTAKDKATVKAFWAKASGRAEDIGSDALAR